MSTPENPWQAVFQVVWPQSRVGRVLVVAVIAPIVALFAFWMTLPDETKVAVLRGRRSSTVEARPFDDPVRSGAATSPASDVIDEEHGTKTENADGWGGIYPVDAQSLKNFMSGIVDLGSVSSDPNDETGIIFRGKVDRTSGRGTIELVVWDEIAANGGKPYYWTLNVESLVIDSNQAIVKTVDSAGSVTFRGHFDAKYWIGNVSFENVHDAGGKSGVLGDFRIEQCFIFMCQP